MRNKALIVLLAIAAAVLTGLHLRLPNSTQSWRMEESAVAQREDVKMAVEMPRGDVDVNRATAEELEKLSGVGPALAQEIIEERETNGAFHYPEDLINVRGIGEKTLERMREELKLP